MKIETVAVLASGLTPLLTAIGSGIWVISRNRREDRMLNLLKEEIAVAEALPAGSIAQTVLREHIDSLSQRYVRNRQARELVSRDTAGIVLATLMLMAGVALTWLGMTATRPWAILSQVLAVPLSVYGVMVGINAFFFHEIGATRSGGGTDPHRTQGEAASEEYANPT
ncbi:hypothetical protein ACIBPB_09985 [Micromonospora sp. NPDC049836]|uniref:hypothetical protein n=1 Tax=Micromonospora sp. NPDC049836 TaxID=3364274 RepID=UPI0037922AA7